MRIIAKTLVVFTLALALALPSFAADDKQAEKDSGNDYIAVVNGTKIPRDRLDQQLTMLKKRFASRGQKLDEKKMADIKDSIVQNMVEKELLYQKSRELGIKVDKEQVQKRLDGFKNRFKNESQYQQRLASMGYTEDQLLHEIEQSMVIKQLIDQEIASKVEITDEDLQSYYDDNTKEFESPKQVKARHILVETDKEADEKEKQAARKKIEKIQKRLEKGEKFSKLAKEESDCQSSKKGGELGFFSKGQMVPPFEKAAFSTEPGNVSDIVETRFGYHLIKVEDKKPASKKSFDEVKGNIQKQLRQKKIQKRLPEYVETLKKKADIEINLPEGA
ncbi:MAG TPA: peptidylprolyl isomerase [Desulfosalsimonadaceae bacterium]|nr:peptidylprolyl isomerase [Desulfosalsimonadaceae bacterium]